jgi:hypothetical protein
LIVFYPNGRFGFLIVLLADFNAWTRQKLTLRQKQQQKGGDRIECKSAKPLAPPGISHTPYHVLINVVAL